MSFRIVLTSLALLISASSFVDAGDEFVAAVFGELSLPLPNTKSVVVCHGFGCQFHTQIALGNADRAKLAELLAPGRASPQAERRALAAAISWLIAEWDPRPAPPAALRWRRSANGDPAQMDCIASQQQQYQPFRDPSAIGPVAPSSGRASGFLRGLVFDGRLPHTTAVVGEVKGGRKWDCGEPDRHIRREPAVEPLEQWLQEGH